MLYVKKVIVNNFLYANTMHCIIVKNYTKYNFELYFSSKLIQNTILFM